LPDFISLPEGGIPVSLGIYRVSRLFRSITGFNRFGSFPFISTIGLIPLQSDWKIICSSNGSGTLQMSDVIAGTISAEDVPGLLDLVVNPFGLLKISALNDSIKK